MRRSNNVEARVVHVGNESGGANGGANGGKRGFEAHDAQGCYIGACIIPCLVTTFYVQPSGADEMRASCAPPRPHTKLGHPPPTVSGCAPHADLAPPAHPAALICSPTPALLRPTPILPLS